MMKRYSRRIAEIGGPDTCPSSLTEGLNQKPVTAPAVEDHRMRCPNCYVLFDGRRLGDVFWHQNGDCAEASDEE